MNVLVHGLCSLHVKRFVDIKYQGKWMSENSSSDMSELFFIDLEIIKMESESWKEKTISERENECVVWRYEIWTCY